MPSACGYSCLSRDQPTELQPYGDISGPGVLAGFLGTAWIVVILVILNYTCAFDPNDDPFHPTANDKADRRWRANPIDAWITGFLHNCGDILRPSDQTAFARWLKGSVSKPRWKEAFHQSLLGMSDIQILTGLGVLVSGFADLRCGISAYHFQLVVHLAWFSNVTHLCALTALRKHLQQNPAQKLVRLSLMVTVSIMLLAAMGPTVFFNWMNHDERTASTAAAYAICFFNPRFADSRAVLGTSALQSAIASMLLLVASLVSRTIKLFPTASAAANSWRSSLSQRWGKSLSHQRCNPVRIAQKALLVVGRLYADILTSTLSDTYWLLVSVTWGTIRLFMTKSSGRVSEDTWSFGQVLPVFLLIAPIFTAAQFFFPCYPTSPLPLVDQAERPTGSSPGSADTTTSPDHPNSSDPASSLPHECDALLKDDFYQVDEYSWVYWVAMMIIIQTVAVTIMIFLRLSKPNTNPVAMLVFFSSTILGGYPVSVLTVTVIRIGFRHYWKKRKGGWISMVIVSTIASMIPMYLIESPASSPVWFWLISPLLGPIVTACLCWWCNG